MKSVGSQIEKLIHEKGLKSKEVAKGLNMTPVNLSKILRKESIDSALLERFAKYFNVPISYFFEDQKGASAVNMGEGNMALAGSGNNFFGESGQPSNTNSKNIELEQKVQHLTELLKQKDIIIAEKERLINTLLKEG